MLIPNERNADQCECVCSNFIVPKRAMLRRLSEDGIENCQHSPVTGFLHDVAGKINGYTSGGTVTANSIVCQFTERKIHPDTVSTICVGVFPWSETSYVPCST